MARTKKYPLKKEPLKVARLALKESNSAYSAGQRAQYKIEREVEKKHKPEYGQLWNEYTSKRSAAEKKQRQAISAHRKKAKVELKPLLADKNKKQATITKHTTATRLATNANYHANKAKREKAKTKRLVKNAPYTPEQERFMEKSPKQFNRTKQAFTMYKKCYIKDSTRSLRTPVLVTMEVPQNTRRACAEAHRYGNSTMPDAKIRVAEAIVTSIRILHGCDIGEETKRVVYSKYDQNFSYKVGKTILPKKDFDPSKQDVCSSGIHGFLGIPSAITYN